MTHHSDNTEANDGNSVISNTKAATLIALGNGQE